MTNVMIEAKCNFCKETIKGKFKENDIVLFNLSINDNTQKWFHKCEKCGRENNFELLLRQVKESEV